MQLLIIDDDPDESELFQAACAEISKEISIADAENYETALSILNRLIPDIIIIDINLGPQSGIDCLKKIKSLPTSSFPVIMFSTSSARHHIDQCFDSGADFFFEKPNTLRELVSILKKLISINWASPALRDRDRFVISG